MTNVTDRPETNDGDYARFLADFGAQLAEGGHSKASQARRRRRIALAAVALGVVLGVVAVAVDTGGGRVNVLAQAEAAIAPAGQVLHLVTTSHLELRGANGAQITGSEAESLGWSQPRVAETWSSSSPTRWRIATTIPTSSAQGSTTAAPIQCAYLDGSEEIYNQALQPNEIDIVPASAAQDGASQESPCTAQVSGGLGAEPLASLHAALQAGGLHSADTTTVDGRPALRLVGQVTSSTGAPWPVEYDVDPITYTPLRFTVEMVGVDTLGNPGTLTEVTDVSAYEQLPVNETTTALLKIKTSGAPVVRHGVNQFQERLRDRAGSAPRASAGGAGLTRARQHRL
jgi:hypothetical protein